MTNQAEVERAKSIEAAQALVEQVRRLNATQAMIPVVVDGKEFSVFVCPNPEGEQAAFAMF